VDSWREFKTTYSFNSLPVVEHSPSTRIVSKALTFILGIDVSNDSSGQSDIPSIATVDSSRRWPLISKYRETVRTQSPKVEMIDSLFKHVSETEEWRHLLITELLINFYKSSGNTKPDRVIIFRDEVNKSQFDHVLNIELDQMIEACKFLSLCSCWNDRVTTHFFLLLLLQNICININLLK
jgi:eukaryotic translation initiation factor 2C